jgi:hypothetical protein
MIRYAGDLTSLGLDGRLFVVGIAAQPKTKGKAGDVEGCELLPGLADRLVQIAWARIHPPLLAIARMLPRRAGAVGPQERLFLVGASEACEQAEVEARRDRAPFAGQDGCLRPPATSLRPRVQEPRSWCMPSVVAPAAPNAARSAAGQLPLVCR